MSDEDQTRHCIVCPRKLSENQAQTCADCVATVRRSLGQIEQDYALLPAELVGRAGAAPPMEPSGVRSDDDPIPGGAVMVLLGPGSPAGNQVRDIITGRNADGAHAFDEYPTDPVSALGELERWEADWRVTFNEGAAEELATVTSCVGYLSDHLDRAAQGHAAFDEFASDIRELRVKLETALRSGPQRSPVPCLTCGGRALERPAPRDDGRAFEWQCARCHRNYTQDEYWMAVRQQGKAV